MSECGYAPAITFVYADWVAIYPQFSQISAAAAQGYFDIATIYCANRLCPIPTISQLTTLLYLLTAHVAWLMAPRNAQGIPSSTGTQFAGIVGRISGATEGTISVQTEFDVPAGTAQWYAQSVWGAAYWAATAVYRTMRYRPGVRRPLGFAGGSWQYPNGS